MIECGSHGRVHGYIVCVHVLAGSAYRHKTEPSDADGVEALGECLCARCVGLDETQVKLDDLKLVCSNCLAKVLGPERPQ